ncbi:Argininosuccinate synthase [Serratia plymuthica]|nr:Argininosuccinate synthase [Serratia plymuthica]
MQNQGIKKIVLAYSGGLDTSAIIPWLKENYGGCEVVAFVADIGQERSDLEGVEQKALQSGASECHVVDLREEFIRDYVYPVLQTGALYEGSYLLGTSMARPIIAKAQVELALKVGADALCHGATGKGNDQVRFETTYTALAPHLKVVAPWREWNLRSREALLDYLKERNIPTTASLEKSTAVTRTPGISLPKAACWKAHGMHRTKTAGSGPWIRRKRRTSLSK